MRYNYRTLSNGTNNMYSTLDEIAYAPVYGNAGDDALLLRSTHCFVIDENNSMEDRVSVLRIMSEKVMGLDGAITEQSVREYTTDYYAES